MKISTSQYFTTMNKLMADTQGKIAQTQSQLSVGKKNVTPSTDVKAVSYTHLTLPTICSV